MSAKLLGFVGQGMRGQKPNRLGQEPYNYPPGSYTFTAPRAGYWKFVAWGPGKTTSANSDAGDSGAYAEITRFLNKGAAVAITVGAPGVNTTLTFADGKVVSAGAATGVGGAGLGVATGGDVNLPGVAGAISGAPGGTAPSRSPYIGGSGGTAPLPAGGAPGGGANAGTVSGGSGLVLAVFWRV